MVHSMVEKQTVNLRRLGGNRSGEVKLHRFLSNKKVSKSELISSIVSKAGNNSVGRHVLCIQDTTELNYQSHSEKVKGLGVVGNNKDVGLFLHPTLVLDAESEVCLGLSSIKIWTRRKKSSPNCAKLSIEEKESYRWIESAQETKAALLEAKQITIIADRESDIYEEWYRIPDEKTHLLTRASYDRRLSNGEKLFDYADKLPIEGHLKVKLKKRAGKRSAHTAELEVQFGKVNIKKPQKCRNEEAPKDIELTIINVRESKKTVVGEESPIHWRLLTTHSIKSIEDALRIIRWYCARWNIEQLFRTLKRQGLNIESSQIQTAEALKKLAIISSYVASITMQLTLARDGKDQHISVVFNKYEREILAHLKKKVEGKTQKQMNPHSPEKLSWASWIIARLGGWKGYASESPPGPITMRRGLEYFEAIKDGFSLAKDVCIA